ncbi:MAG: 16S rRNA (cytosine(1402)-N(4))-methyltransferase RsmH [Anaerolineae bacterium]|nr:16S rRNA (cytosine(1402)-N(4))-methyltransferase RsmH [Anaerolineae bacterium]
MEQDAPHISVLLKEVLVGLDVQPGGHYIDGTIGAGGHAKHILQASKPGGQLLGLDADPEALAISKKRLACFGDRVILVKSNFAYLKSQADLYNFHPVDGILFDLGLSSMELQNPERGFSFLLDGPLDMRFDPNTSRTAADLIDALSERELAELIYRYGEEPASRVIARAIVSARPLHTTTELAAVVAKVVRKKGKIHPATRTFQALRIAVNDELRVLEQGLSAAIETLGPGGRLAVISFHSLEDRIVKQFFAREARDCICPPEFLTCTCKHQAVLNIVTRKPIRPSEIEVDRNPRSRSAKLRIVTKR